MFVNTVIQEPLDEVTQSESTLEPPASQVNEYPIRFEPILQPKFNEESHTAQIEEQPVVVNPSSVNEVIPSETVKPKEIIQISEQFIDTTTAEENKPSDDSEKIIQESIDSQVIEESQHNRTQSVQPIEQQIPIVESQIMPDQTDEADVIEPIIQTDEVALLPAPLEELVVLVSENDGTEVNFHEHLENLINAMEVETDLEEVNEALETFSQSVADIKATVDTAEEIAHDQIESLVASVILLLETLSIEPKPENITKIIVLSLGEEFAAQYEHLIDASLLNELGTHERKLWVTKLKHGDNMQNDRPSLLGRLALQLGLTTQVA